MMNDPSTHLKIRRSLHSLIKNISFRIIYVVIMLMFSVSFIEIALRTIYREEAVSGSYWGKGSFVEDANLGYRHAPNFRGFAYREGVFDSFFSISKEGLRQQNVQAQADYPIRLLLLGDSFTVGVGVSEKESFAHLIQETLNPHNIGVINGGQSGYGIVQEATLGMLLAAKFRPKAIVLCIFLGNDIREDFRGGYKGVEVRYGIRMSKNRWMPDSSIDFLKAHSYFVQYLNGRVLSRWQVERPSEQFSEQFKKDPESVLKPTLDAIHKLQVFCADHGIELGVMIIPRRKPPKREGRILDEKVRRALQERSIPYLDLSGKMIEKQDYFQKDGHWNSHGHEKAASHLTTFVENLLGWVPIRGAPPHRDLGSDRRYPSEKR